MYDFPPVFGREPFVCDDCFEQLLKIWDNLIYRK